MSGQLGKFYWSLFSVLEQTVMKNTPQMNQSNVNSPQQPQFKQGYQQQFGNNSQLSQSSLQNINSPITNNNNANQNPKVNSTDFLNQALDSMTTTANNVQPTDVKDEVVNTPITSTQEEVEELSTKSDEVITDDMIGYFPKTRKVTTLGGIDLNSLAPVLKRNRPSKDKYSILINRFEEFLKPSQEFGKWFGSRSKIRSRSDGYL